MTYQISLPRFEQSFVRLLPIALLTATTLTACVDDSNNAQNINQTSQSQQKTQSFQKPIQPTAVFFPNKQQVTYGELLQEMEKIASELESSEILRDEFKQLQSSHGIADTEEMYKDFVRVRLAFEATRDSGLWQLRWAVTDQQPNSDKIWQQWKQWRQQTNPQVNFQTKPQTSLQSRQSTATAECDELSALFAVIARGLGVAEVGLFWPTSNHTVAVWKAKGNSVKGDKGQEVRVVVPTSQIFLNNQATLGTMDFDPYQQKNIYNYTRQDVKSTDKIPASLAEMMLTQLTIFAGQSSKQLQQKRNQLSEILGGS